MSRGPREENHKNQFNVQWHFSEWQEKFKCRKFFTSILFRSWGIRCNCKKIAFSLHDSKFVNIFFWMLNGASHDLKAHSVLETFFVVNRFCISLQLIFLIISRFKLHFLFSRFATKCIFNANDNNLFLHNIIWMFLSTRHVSYWNKSNGEKNELWKCNKKFSAVFILDRSEDNRHSC